MNISRRRFLEVTGLALAGHATQARAAEGPLIELIEKVVLSAPEVKGGAWFHPRACMVGKRAFMTLQAITGSDYFGPLHWTTSDDLGKTWSEFLPVPPLGWEPEGEGAKRSVM
ncbi:hypothetical protein CfE428DRAFT_1059 [Chthoniobacter flavus Ellin428]|uniref:Uncharacterized protein n=1 Tax=Chthoniobacter flavus Ellin428 TaxID=497964 RepID=B4CWM1_9BACT|nr:hypothetical protein [Chthoniobacter flavus]EDY21813.1 hypothetical protein CfE428DRAFT_1059 [Chthoniobacter flavus Ellin428]